MTKDLKDRIELLIESEPIKPAKASALLKEAGELTAIAFRSIQTSRQTEARNKGSKR